MGKYVSTLFDYGRFEDQKQSDEINEYFSLNVDPTARPLNINVDYWDAIYRVQQNIQDVLMENAAEQIERIRSCLL